METLYILKLINYEPKSDILSKLYKCEKNEKNTEFVNLFFSYFMALENKDNEKYIFWNWYIDNYKYHNCKTIIYNKICSHISITESENIILQLEDLRWSIIQNIENLDRQFNIPNSHLKFQFLN